MADQQGLPSEEELRDALDRVGVADILLNALSAAASIGFRRVGPEGRDLGQVKLAIEALRALDPVLRDAGVDEAIVRDLRAGAGEPPARLRRGGVRADRSRPRPTRRLARR